MRSEQYHPALGKVVESAILSLLNRVLALEDITEVESERLAAMISEVETLDHLFSAPGGGLTTAPTFVPHWLKLCYTHQLLVSQCHIGLT